MNKPITGYIYRSDAKINSASAYAIGDLIKNETREPPYIVVDHRIEKINYWDWPGKLYEVEVVDPVSDQEMALRGPGSRIKADAGYTRAVAVKITKILNTSLLFGENGKEICDLLDWIKTMDYPQAEKLGRAIDPQANAIYSKAWDSWLLTMAPNNIHLYSDHSYTVAIPTERHNPDSPINGGFSLIANLARQQAQKISGDAAMVTIEPDEDEEREPEKVLAPAWDKARNALLHAAMGMGARRWISETDCEILMSAWNKTVNLDESKK